MNDQFKKGFSELLILKIINNKESYGYDINRQVNKYIYFKESSVYLILSRLRQKGYLKTQIKETNNKKIKYFYLTEHGLEYLKDLEESWKTLNETLKSIGENDEKN